MIKPKVQFKIRYLILGATLGAWVSSPVNIEDQKLTMFFGSLYVLIMLVRLNNKFWDKIINFIDRKKYHEDDYLQEYTTTNKRFNVQKKIKSLLRLKKPRKGDTSHILRVLPNQYYFPRRKIRSIRKNRKRKTLHQEDNMQQTRVLYK